MPKKDPVDETSLESFPASDPPAWTGSHAGAPSGAPVVVETPTELTERLREDLVVLARDVHERADHIAEVFHREGRSCTRTPVGRARKVEAVECVIPGEAPGLVAVARYDGRPASAAVLLGLARLFEGQQRAHRIRLVAIPTELAVAWDAAFGALAGSAGQVFVAPLAPVIIAAASEEALSRSGLRTLTLHRDEMLPDAYREAEAVYEQEADLTELTTVTFQLATLLEQLSALSP